MRDNDLSKLLYLVGQEMADEQPLEADAIAEGSAALEQAEDLFSKLVAYFHEFPLSMDEATYNCNCYNRTALLEAINRWADQFAPEIYYKKVDEHIELYKEAKKTSKSMPDTKKT